MSDLIQKKENVTDIQKSFKNGVLIFIKKRIANMNNKHKENAFQVSTQNSKNPVFSVKFTIGQNI